MMMIMMTMMMVMMTMILQKFSDRSLQLTNDAAQINLLIISHACPKSTTFMKLSTWSHFSL